METRALIAMSGGVDSSAAAWLVRQAGYICAGAIMQLWEGADPGAIADARSVASRLGMDFHILDMTREFRCRVMDDFVASYQQGLTPNPCIQCNRHLKFGQFLQKAQQLGCSHIATGHFARIIFDRDSGRYRLYKAADKSKDQSYVLYSLTQHQLAHTLLPLGELTKEQARGIAREQGFLNAGKKDSQDICFVPDGDYVAFIRRHTGQEAPAGAFLDLQGQVVGTHKGAIGYTLGQRKGLGLAMGAPVYVCGKDMTANTVTVGPNEALFRTSLRADDWNWIALDTLREPLRVLAKARYRHTEQPATAYPEADGCVRVVFDEPQRALTPGQAVVLYQGDLVLGGGTIREIL